MDGSTELVVCEVWRGGVNPVIDLGSTSAPLGNVR